MLRNKEEQDAVEQERARCWRSRGEQNSGEQGGARSREQGGIGY